MNGRLSAVLAADIEGYSRLMSADTSGTLAALRQLRSELFAPGVAGHRGKVVKSMGDGWLVEFSSAVDAVSCAMQVQDSLARHPTIRLRIGIHIGDVVHEDDDIFGDGVNIASRLEGIAAPGGIAISESTYASLDGTLRPSFDDAGVRELKNIERPVQVWMRGAREEAPSGRAGGEGARAGTRLPRLGIVPVATVDRRGEIRALAASLTSDLAGYVGGTRWLSASVSQSPPAGAYTLATTLRSNADRLRLEVRLDEPDGRPFWSEKFDGDLGDGFAWQDHVSEEVAAQTLWHILDLERAKLEALTVEEMSAEECNLRGLIALETVDSAAVGTALRHHALAIEKDPGLADAYADAIAMFLGGTSLGYDAEVAPYRERFPGWLKDGSALPGAGTVVHLAIAIAVFTRGGDPATLKRAIRDALRREPLSMDVSTFCGWGYVWLGEPEPALDCFARGRRLRRFSPWAIPAIGGEALACVQAGRDEAAVERARRGLEVAPDYGTLHRAMASALAHLGRTEEAAAAVADALRLVPTDSVSSGRARIGYGDTPGTRRYFEGLRLAGMPE